MSNPIKIGLVGLGRAGHGMHVPELKDRQDKFNFYAVCDLLPERTKLMNEQFGSKEYSSIDDLVNDPEVELVVIATRSCDHFAHAMKAIEAGKDVLIEKPMCVTTAEAKIITEIARDPSKPNVYYRFNRRAEEHFTTIRNVIASGKLGEILDFRITRNGFSRRTDWQLLKEYAGGNLLNWGPHVVDQALVLLDSPVKSVWSDLRHTIGGGDAEDHVDIILKGENGRVAKLEISNDRAIKTPDYEVHGTRGACVWMGGVLKLRYIDPEQKIAPAVASGETPGASFGKTGTFAATETFNWIEEEIPCNVGDINGIWDSLYYSIREGKPYPITHDEAFRVIETINLAKAGTPFEVK